MSDSSRAIASLQGRLRWLYKVVWGITRRDDQRDLELSLRSELRARLLDLLLFYRRFLVVVFLLLFLLLLIPVVARVLILAWSKQGYPPLFYVIVPLSTLLGISGIALSVVIITGLLCALALIGLLLFQVSSTAGGRLIFLVVSRVLGLDVRGLQIIRSRVNRRAAPFFLKVISIALAVFGIGASVVLGLFDNIDRVIEYGHVILLFVLIIFCWTAYRLRETLVRGEDRQYVRGATISGVLHFPLQCFLLGVMVFIFLPLGIGMIVSASEGLYWFVARPVFVVGMTQAREYVAAPPPAGGPKKKLPSRQEVITEGDELARSLPAGAKKWQERVEEFLNVLKPSLLTAAILMVVGGIVVPIAQLKGLRAVTIAITACHAVMRLLNEHGWDGQIKR